MARLLVREMRNRMELESVVGPAVDGGMLGRRELRPLLPRPRPRGRRIGGERRELGDGVNTLDGPGVRLIVCWLASMMREVTWCGERKEVSREAVKTPVSCKSAGPLAKSIKKPMQLPSKPIARRR